MDIFSPRRFISISRCVVTFRDVLSDVIVTDINFVFSFFAANVREKVSRAFFSCGKLWLSVEFVGAEAAGLRQVGPADRVNDRNGAGS
jgi:hypothetical protein